MINVTVIGFGNVGSSLTLLLLKTQHALRLNIMEPDEQAEGAFLDLAHGMSLYQDKELHFNDERLFLNSDFIFHTAGTPNVSGASRLTTAQQNVELTKEIFEHRDFVREPFIVVIANPVDIVSHAVERFSGVPAKKVVGTGTFIDSMCMSYYLSRLSKQKAVDFETFVLGEHGSSQVPIFSQTKLNGKPIFDDAGFSAKVLDLAAQLTRNAANKIRETQTGTTYGVSKCAESLMNYLLGNEEHLLTLSVLTDEHYRALLELEHDIYISLPVKVKNGKVELFNELDFSKEELDALRKSGSILAAVAQ